MILQRNLSIAKSDYQEAKDQSNTAQHQRAAAEKELQETQSRAHADKKQATAKIKALEVGSPQVLRAVCL